MTKLLTTQQAAERLGITDARVRQLILSGRVPAQKLGRDLFIEEGDLKLVQDRKPGRPRRLDKPEGSKKREKK
jgi:excisionase family DNA binding protein